MSTANNKPIKKAQSTDVEAKIGERLFQYRRRVNLISWVGAGLLAEITIYASIRFGGTAAAPGTHAAILSALVPTCVLIAGGSLAWARVQFEWLADVLYMNLKSNIVRAEDLMAEKANSMGIQPGWPTGAEWLYRLELLFTVLGAFFLLALIWVSALTSPARS